MWGVVRMFAMRFAVGFWSGVSPGEAQSLDDQDYIFGLQK